jgi:hypothetical protein
MQLNFDFEKSACAQKDVSTIKVEPWLDFRHNHTDFQQGRADFSWLGLKLKSNLKNHGQTSVELGLNGGRTQGSTNVRLSSKVNLDIARK